MTKIHLVIVIDEGPEGGVEILAAHRTRTNARITTEEFNRYEPGYMRYAVASEIDLED